MKESFVAFGFGPRLCPGMQLAMIEAQLLIITIMHYYDLSIACLVNEIIRELSFVTALNKLPLHLKKRHV